MSGSFGLMVAKYIYKKELTEKDFFYSVNNKLFHKKNSASG